VDIIKKVSDKFLITGTEAKVFLLLAVLLLAGSGYRYFTSIKQPAYLSSDSDSLLVAVNADDNEPEISRTEDYKNDVLNLNERSHSDKKVLPKEKSIDINTAGIKVLLTLPGIGNKTAQNIIDFREKHGRINKANELLDVKGIGEVKLGKLRKYLTIE